MKSPLPSAIRRRGFTLVELLVVVGIIGALAALVVPAVVNARNSARVGAVRTEVELLSTALMNYKAEYQSFPPCQSTTSGTDRAGRHLKRLFPRCADVEAQMGSAAVVTPQNAILTWLLGYTNDPSSPLQPQSSRRALFDFDRSRIVIDTYMPDRLPNSPFVYIDSAAYGTVASPTQFVIGTGTYQAQTRVVGTGTSFFNPDTFQILCAGLDGVWGTDDDVSNFWQRTRATFRASGQ